MIRNQIHLLIPYNNDLIRTCPTIKCHSYFWLFSCRLQYYNDFGDIIKETLCRTRQTDKTESTRTLVLSLQQVYLTSHTFQNTVALCVITRLLAA